MDNNIVINSYNVSILGLVSLDEMKAKEKDIIEQRKKKLAEKAEDILHIAKCKAIEANNLAKKREKQV